MRQTGGIEDWRGIGLGKERGEDSPVGCYIALTMGFRKNSPAAGEFLFEIDSEPLEECLTALGGIPLLVRAARSLDVPGSVERHLRVKQRERGFDEATYVERSEERRVGKECRSR